MTQAHSGNVGRPGLSKYVANKIEAGFLVEGSPGSPRSFRQFAEAIAAPPEGVHIANFIEVECNNTNLLSVDYDGNVLINGVHVGQIAVTSSPPPSS